LEQAAAYAGQYLAGHQQPLARYLQLFQERHFELLARGRPLEYKGTVDATFTLALDRLRDSHPPTAPLLEIFAMLAADELPIDVLLSQPEQLPHPLGDAAREPLTKNEMVAALFDAGLLMPGPGGIARTHLLVQIVTRAHLSDSERRQRVGQAVQLLAALFPDEGWEPDRQPRCALLLPHAQAALEHAATEKLTTAAVAQLLTSVGHYLWSSRLALPEALDLHQRALAINRRLYQGDHPATAQTLSNLALDMRRLGDVEQARKLDTQALEMRQRLYANDHPAIADSLAGLAANLRALGDAKQAMKLNTQALTMRRRLYHGDHPYLARSLHGLAMDLRVLGQVRQAMELDRSALDMRRRLYQIDHPAIAYSAGNLAVDLQLLEEWHQAYQIDKEALAMQQRLHQDDHPDVAIALSNLANDLYMLGDVNQAGQLDSRALRIHQRVHDHDNLVIVESLRNLAVDMHALGKVGEARRLDEEASAMHNRLRESNDSTADSRPYLDIASFSIARGRRARPLDD
jgi:tetratricopeptide (TPR) repeat protein